MTTALLELEKAYDTTRRDGVINKTYISNSNSNTTPSKDYKSLYSKKKNSNDILSTNDSIFNLYFNNISKTSNTQLRGLYADGTALFPKTKQDNVRFTNLNFYLRFWKSGNSK